MVVNDALPLWEPIEMFAASSAYEVNKEEAEAILERLAARRSCREFDGSEVDRETLAAIIADGVQAPSSCNQQNWHFIVVTDPDRKKRAREISGGNHHFEFCSALIYLCFQKGWTHGNFSIVQSVAGACYHMMLSAHLRGLDCIWNAGIGDHGALREMLDLPPNFEVQGALAVGRAKPTATPMKAPRRPVDDIFSWETFERPASSVYPVKPSDSYPYFEIRNDQNPYAEWNPRLWTWDQVGDFRGYAVWAKSPIAGVYISRRQGDAQTVENSLLPNPLTGKVVEVMPWGGTSTVYLCEALGPDTELSVAELSQHNLSFIRERLRAEGYGDANVGFELMPGGRLPYSSGSVSTVVLPQVLEHMPDPEALLDEVHRVLAPGGSVVASVRNMSSAYGQIWREQESRGQVPNQGPFTPIEATRVCDWLSERFVVETEVGIGSQAVGDAETLSGNDTFSGRLYAARARRA